MPADMPEEVTVLSVGWMRIGVVRDLLKQAQFRGFPVEWIETGPWYAREFHLKGEDIDLLAERIKKLGA